MQLADVTVKAFYTRCVVAWDYHLAGSQVNVGCVDDVTVRLALMWVGKSVKPSEGNTVIFYHCRVVSNYTPAGHWDGTVAAFCNAAAWVCYWLMSYTLRGSLEQQFCWLPGERRVYVWWFTTPGLVRQRDLENLFGIDEQESWFMYWWSGVGDPLQWTKACSVYTYAAWDIPNVEVHDYWEPASGLLELWSEQEKWSPCSRVPSYWVLKYKSMLLLWT